VGIQYRSGTPLPLNQRTKRLSIGEVVAAYIVPVELNIDTKGGSASPCNKVRREMRTRLVITLAMVVEMPPLVVNESLSQRQKEKFLAS
jgi:hypothetical protein